MKTLKGTNASKMNASNKFKLNKALIIILTFTIIISQIANAKDIPILRYIACIIIIMSVMLSNNNRNYIYAIMFILTNNKVLSIAGISTATILTFIYFIKAYLFEKRKLDQKLVIASLLLVIYTLQYCFSDVQLVILHTVKLIVLLIFCIDLLATDEVYLVKHFLLLIYYAILGILISAIFTMIFNPSMLNEARFALSSESGENTLGIISAILMSYCLLIYCKGEKNKSFLIISVLFLSGIGIMTGSKTFVILSAIALIWTGIPIIAFGSFRKKAICLAFLLIVLSCSYLVMKNGSILNMRVSFIINRLISPKNNDISNGRFIIWNSYISFLKENPFVVLFGAGSYTKLGFNIMAHNMLIEQIVLYGVFGNILIIWLYSIAAKILILRMKKNMPQIKADLYGSLPIALIFGAGITSHAFINMTNTVLFYLGLISVYTVKISSQTKYKSAMKH